MQANPYRGSRRNRPGFLLVMLVLTIALMALLYYAQILRFFRSIPKYSDPNALPWEEKFLIRSETLHGYGLHKRQKYSSEQTKIKQTTLFTANVYEGEYSRGEVEFRIHADGTIRGHWSADYTTYEPRIHHATVKDVGSHFESNTFRGNIAPSKTYEDEHGQDKSRLYIIAEGRFLLGTHDVEKEKARKMWGDIYLTGWIDPEYNGAGWLTLVPECLFTPGPRPSYELMLDKEVLMVFDWQGSPVE